MFSLCLKTSSFIYYFVFLPSVSDCHQIALCFLIRIVSFDPKYKEVFSDVGVLEVLTNCLKQYADGLKEKYDGMLNKLSESVFIIHIKKEDCSLTKQLSFELSHLRISPTELKVKETA